jgi:hypothetical protein
MKSLFGHGMRRDTLEPRRITPIEFPGRKLPFHAIWLWQASQRALAIFQAKELAEGGAWRLLAEAQVQVSRTNVISFPPHLPCVATPPA